MRFVDYMTLMSFVCLYLVQDNIPLQPTRYKDILYKLTVYVYYKKDEGSLTHLINMQDHSVIICVYMTLL